MKSLNLKNPALGWIAACLIGGFTFLSGFQGGAEKTGVIDLNKVIQQSELGKSNTKKLNDALSLRRGLIDFLTTYMVLTTEQAESLRQLTLKAAQTEADKAQIEKIKKDVMESDKKRQDLMSKSTLTETDKQLLQDYSQRARINEERAGTWDKEFSMELNELRDQLQQDTISQAKATLAETAKAQGYTTVLESTVAPYGANDLTDATVKVLNAKKR